MEARPNRPMTRKQQFIGLVIILGWLCAWATLIAYFWTRPARAHCDTCPENPGAWVCRSTICAAVNGG